jgi:adenosylcobinamide-GDP ribazoletransferase
LLIGAFLLLVWLGLDRLPGSLPPLASAGLLLAVWTWITGGLHLDGLSDCADAWVGGLGSRERSFAILKDPHTGSMGVVALVLILLLKFSALASLMTLPTGLVGGLLLLLTPALARAQLLALPLTTVSARAEGLGAALSQALPRRRAWLTWLLTWGLALLLFGWAGVWLLGLAMAAMAGALFFVWRRSMLERLGGFTGDTAGALLELTETAILLAGVLLTAVAYPV